MDQMNELSISLTVSTTGVPSHQVQPADWQQWALPVRFEKLGAHLEAYVETIPAITALRLCNRFGKGANCYIHKLPIELVQMIEDIIIERERERCLVPWSKQTRCWLQECDDFTDHMTPEEQIAYCARFDCQAKDRNDLAHEPCEAPHGHTCCELSQFRSTRNQKSSDAAEKRLDKKLSFIKGDRVWCDSDSDEVEVKLAAFRETNLETYDDRGTYSVHEYLLRTHFGIGVWATPKLLDTNRWTTLAYLTLPRNPREQEQWPNQHRDGYESSNDSGHGMPIHLGAAPSPASLKRFPNALRRLGLELFVNPNQKSTTGLWTGDCEVEVPNASDETVARDKVTGKDGTWPQLTLLLHSMVSEFPWR
jgi:hypothetical protein